MCLLVVRPTTRAQLPDAVFGNTGFEATSSDGGTAASWTWITPSGADATLHVVAGADNHKTDNSTVHSGSHAFEAGVNRLGNTGDKFPKLAHVPFSADPHGTYMVRFFARSSGDPAVNRPAMRLLVTSAAGTTTPASAEEVFYPSEAGWDEYHYSFRAAGPTTISFTFEQTATFNLDDVQVYDQNDPTYDTLTMYLWQWGFNATNNNADPNVNKTCWTGGDGNWSAVLPDGRVGWFFCDSFAGHINYSSNKRSVSNSRWQFVRNYAALESADPRTSATLTPLFTALPSSKSAPHPQPACFAPPSSYQGKNHFFWPNDAIAEGNNLQAILTELDSNNHNKFVGRQIVTLSPPNYNTATYTPIPWGTEFLDAGDGYLYIYENAGKGQNVARVAYGKLTNPEQWQYWQGGTSWGYPGKKPDKMVPVPGMSRSSFGTCECLGPNHYAAIDGTMGASVQFAQSPVGPWTKLQGACVAGPPPQLCNTYGYANLLHKETGQNGVYSIGWCDNTESPNPELTADAASLSPGNTLWPTQQMNRCSYNPRYLKTKNLLNLSPYKLTSYTDTFSNVNEGSAWWRSYGGTWTVGNHAYGVTLPASGPSAGGAYSIFKGLVADPAANSQLKSGDVTVQATVACHPLDANGCTGLLLHGSSYDVGATNFNGYVVVLKPGVGVGLLRMDANGGDGGGSTLLRPWASTVPIFKDRSYTLMVRCAPSPTGTGQELTVSLNGQLQFIYSESKTTYATGGVGVYTYHAGGYQWANFSASTLTS